MYTNTNIRRSKNKYKNIEICAYIKSFHSLYIFSVNSKFRNADWQCKTLEVNPCKERQLEHHHNTIPHHTQTWTHTSPNPKRWAPHIRPAAALNAPAIIINEGAVCQGIFASSLVGEGWCKLIWQSVACCTLVFCCVVGPPVVVGGWARSARFLEITNSGIQSEPFSSLFSSRAY